MAKHSDKRKGVFINCPFDTQYQPLFDAILFTVIDCGFKPRCSLENYDGGSVRIEYISKLISECEFGIHDISRNKGDKKTGYARFNMPYELGLFIGASKFGTGKQKNKKCLILESKKYEYQKYLSDISGQDTYAHKNNEATLIRIVRDWLSQCNKTKELPSSKYVVKKYNAFKKGLPAFCKTIQWDHKNLKYHEQISAIEQCLYAQKGTVY